MDTTPSETSSLVTSSGLSEPVVPTESHDKLLAAIQELANVHDLASLTAIASSYARKLTQADGAAFVLKDADRCFYVDENAVGPLWKGRKFPMSACISGWVMRNRVPVTINDVLCDSRVPQEAYRPTFVRSLAMVPINPRSPVGALGVYWAATHRPTDTDIERLQALSNATTVALENIELRKRLDERTLDIEKVRNELDRYTWILSRDVRDQLSAIVSNLDSFVKVHGSSLDAQSEQWIGTSRASANHLSRLVRDALTYKQVAGTQAGFRIVRSETIVEEVLSLLEPQISMARASVVKQNLPEVRSTPALLSQLFSHLVVNCIKYCSSDRSLVIEIGAEADGADWRFFVADNGIGIAPEKQRLLFRMFQPLHGGAPEQEGTGLGLALCQKIVSVHGGRIEISSELDKGTTVFFTIPATVPNLESAEGSSAHRAH